MQDLFKSKLISKKIAKEDEGNVFKDEDLSWKYFDELKFDVILANPPFAGEMKDKKNAGPL
jgi:type I restriction enzyme M protein